MIAVNLHALIHAYKIEGLQYIYKHVVNHEQATNLLSQFGMCTSV